MCVLQSRLQGSGVVRTDGDDRWGGLTTDGEGRRPGP